MPPRYIPASVRSAVIAKASGCFYCGTPYGPFELDHFLPVSRGGDATSDNIVLACFTCNRAKGGLFPSVFLRRQAAMDLAEAHVLRRKADALSHVAAGGDA